MDKRTVLALALVAIVIIVTPKLFPVPTPVPAPSPVMAPRDSLQGDTGSLASERVTLPGDPVTAAVPRQDSGVPVKPAEGVASEEGPPVETTTIRSEQAEFQFTSQGAAPHSVVLPGYAALDGSDQRVVLTAIDQPLINYRLIGVSDTAVFNRGAFALEQSNAVEGRTELTYRGTVGGYPVQIRYHVVADSFVAHVEGSIGANASGVAPSFLLIDLPKTLRSFEADSIEDQNHFAYAIKPILRNAEGIGFGSLDPGERKVVTGPLAWGAMKSKYFIVGVLALEGDQSFAEAQAIGGARTSRTATVATGTLVARLNNGNFRFDLYAGPQKDERLRAMGREFENSNPYGGFLQGVVQPFATIVMKILLWMRANFQLEYGWILIIFGIAVRLILWPLNHGAMRTSMRMQRIQPELNEIQKKYKSDPQKLQSEMMRVYKEHDMSPFSTFAGCLPLLLPMPVLFALFFVFQNTIEFRGVPFLWLNDISLKDPFYIVPLLMGGSMFILSWVGMRNAPPNPQAKMMLYVFPVMMTFLFANFASGLNLYYAIQNFAAIPQQWLIANERGKAASRKT